MVKQLPGTWSSELEQDEVKGPFQTKSSCDSTIKYRRMFWGHQGLWDHLSHPISSSALIPALPSPYRSWTRLFLIQAKVEFSPNQDKTQFTGNGCDTDPVILLERGIWVIMMETKPLKSLLWSSRELGMTKLPGEIRRLWKRVSMAGLC